MTSDYQLREIMYDGGIFKDSIRWVVPIKSGEALDPIKELIVNNQPIGEAIGAERIINSICTREKDKTFLDIGANIGIYSVYFSKRGWETYAVEAADDNAYALCDTAEKNNLFIRLEKRAIYDKSIDVFFYDNGPYGHIIEKKEVNEKKKIIQIQALRLDDWKETKLGEAMHVDFIKMDIEGAEVAALRGGREFFEHYNKPPVYCESNKWTLFLQNETSKTLVDEFKKIGYEAYYVSNIDGKLRKLDNMQIICVLNIWFIKKETVLSKEVYSDEVVIKDYVEEILMQLESDNENELMGHINDLRDYQKLINDKRIKEKLLEIKTAYEGNPMFEKAFNPINRYIS